MDAQKGKPKLSDLLLAIKSEIVKADRLARVGGPSILRLDEVEIEFSFEASLEPKLGIDFVIKSELGGTQSTGNKVVVRYEVAELTEEQKQNFQGGIQGNQGPQDLSTPAEPVVRQS
jgi:hypothetical protein